MRHDLFETNTGLIVSFSREQFFCGEVQLRNTVGGGGLLRMGCRRLAERTSSATSTAWHIRSDHLQGLGNVARMTKVCVSNVVFGALALSASELLLTPILLWCENHLVNDVRCVHDLLPAICLGAFEVVLPINASRCRLYLLVGNGLDTEMMTLCMRNGV